MTHRTTCILLTAAGLLLGVSAQEKPWLAPLAGKTPTQYCVNQAYDFKDGKISNHFNVHEGSKAEVKDGAMVLYMKSAGGGKPGVASIVDHTAFFSHYGVWSADIKLQHVPGAVYTWILRAEGKEEGRDEIDFEWVNKNNEVQSNIFANGHVVFGVFGGHHPVSPDVSQWHNYKIDWNEDRIIWSIDGQPVRTWEASGSRWSGQDSVKGTTFTDWMFPVKPMRLEFGMWDAAASGSDGTTRWAGGPIDWSKFPDGIKYEIKNIKIECKTENKPPEDAFAKSKDGSDSGEGSDDGSVADTDDTADTKAEGSESGATTTATLSVSLITGLAAAIYALF